MFSKCKKNISYDFTSLECNTELKLLTQFCWFLWPKFLWLALWEIFPSQKSIAEANKDMWNYGNVEILYMRRIHVENNGKICYESHQVEIFNRQKICVKNTLFIYILNKLYEVYVRIQINHHKRKHSVG